MKKKNNYPSVLLYIDIIEKMCYVIAFICIIMLFANTFSDNSFLFLGIITSIVSAVSFKGFYYIVKAAYIYIEKEEEGNT